jgi:uncharacterized phage-like protein YoqJ
MSFTRVMVTGHRPQHLSEGAQVWAAGELERLAFKLADDGMEVGISGLALGADTWWASAVLAAGVPLWSFVPFPQQADKWSRTDQATWQYLQGRSARVWEIAPRYSVQALHARNDRMLDAADLVIAVWDPFHQTGGTASCVQKALGRGLPIVHVDVSRQVTVMKRAA